MSNFFRALRSRKKLLLIWGALLLIVGAVRFEIFCRRQGKQYCELLDQYGGSVIPVALVVIGILFLLQLRRTSSLKGTFGDAPELFHEKVVNLQGTVRYILPDTTAEKLRRRITDKFRTLTNNDDSEGRFIHQRFLLSSPSLRRGNAVLVEHNVNYGKVSIKPGTKVEVQGIYLHTVDGSSRHRYGRIHFTHSPHGFLNVLD